MGEILQAVQRVTDIMGEIAAASEEQSSGISQVGRAVTQMDEVTQQNAALVEQAAAAAASLQDQAGRLRDTVSAFRLSGTDGGSQSSAVLAARRVTATTRTAAAREVSAAAQSAPASSRAEPKLPVSVRAAVESASAPVATVASTKPVGKPRIAAEAAKATPRDDEWTTF
jgi:methyl-accepting chemotaxis protein